MKLAHPCPAISATVRTIPRSDAAGSPFGGASAFATRIGVSNLISQITRPLSKNFDPVRSCPASQIIGDLGTVSENGTNW
jgi:hypothetical protein